MNKTMMRNMTTSEMLNIKDDLDRESLIILADKLQEQVETLEWRNESLCNDLESAEGEQPPIENELFSLVQNNPGLSLELDYQGMIGYTVRVIDEVDNDDREVVYEQAHDRAWVFDEAYKGVTEYLKETRDGH